ncbi:metaxin-2-like isoform X2 [Convolutriloba macropyga]|uniref:metaxin-2-like isoform X2 n=1 Tax=Convolutriloba macropyga TaxID=536237 RepID=UPI003F52223C
MALNSSFHLATMSTVEVSFNGEEEDEEESDESTRKSSRNRRIPWPTDIILYLPTNDQLSADYMEYKIERRRNAEFLGPDKQWPVIRSADKLASGFENIVDYVRLMGYLPSLTLSELEQAEVTTYLVYIDSTFQSVEKYLCWCTEKEYSLRTKPKHFSRYSQPLSSILAFLKHWEISTNLSVLGYPSNEAGLARIFEDLTTLCKAVSLKLEKNRSEGKGFLFGGEMTEVDVVFASHVEAMQMLFVSFEKLQNLFNEEYPLLIEFAKDCMQSISNPKELLA